MTCPWAWLCGDIGDLEVQLLYCIVVKIKYNNIGDVIYTARTYNQPGTISQRDTKATTLTSHWQTIAIKKGNIDT